MAVLIDPRQASRTMPMDLFKDGDTYRLGDGWHRILAFELAGKTEVLCEVRKGDERDCRLFACSATKHCCPACI